jgi:hypothetical protein
MSETDFGIYFLVRGAIGTISEGSFKIVMGREFAPNLSEKLTLRTNPVVAKYI